MPDIVINISGGIFLLSLTYLSNWFFTALTIASSCSVSASSISSTSCASTMNSSVLACSLFTLTLLIPSINTFTVPSGNLNNWIILPIVPTSERSACVGSLTCGSL